MTSRRGCIRYKVPKVALWSVLLIYLPFPRLVDQMMSLNLCWLIVYMSESFVGRRGKTKKEEAFQGYFLVVKNSSRGFSCTIISTVVIQRRQCTKWLETTIVWPPNLFRPFLAKRPHCTIHLSTGKEATPHDSRLAMLITPLTPVIEFIYFREKISLGREKSERKFLSREKISLERKFLSAERSREKFSLGREKFSLGTFFYVWLTPA